MLHCSRNTIMELSLSLSSIFLLFFLLLCHLYGTQNIYIVFFKYWLYKTVGTSSSICVTKWTYGCETYVQYMCASILYSIWAYKIIAYEWNCFCSYFTLILNYMFSRCFLWSDLCILSSAKYSQRNCFLYCWLG